MKDPRKTTQSSSWFSTRRNDKWSSNSVVVHHLCTCATTPSPDTKDVVLARYVEWGVHIMSYGCIVIHTIHQAIISICDLRASHLGGSVARSCPAKKSMKSSSSQATQKSMNWASNSVGDHHLCTCSSSANPDTMDLLLFLLVLGALWCDRY